MIWKMKKIDFKVTLIIHQELIRDLIFNAEKLIDAKKMTSLLIYKENIKS